MKDSFIFYDSFLNALDELESEIELEIYRAITHYALRNEEPQLTGVAKAVFHLIKPQIDANNKRYEDGKKGGRPKNENKKTSGFENKKTSGFENKKPLVLKNDEIEKPNVNVNDNVNDNVNENVNENENVKCEAINTHAHDEVFSNSNEWFGEFANVHLTKRQYDLLINEILDKDKLNELIGELSENIACNTGKAPPYDDKSPDMHYAILRKYWRYRKLNGGTRPQTQSDKAKAFKDELDKLTEQYRLKEANIG